MAWRRRFVDVAAAALIALALSVALGVVSGLAWPYDGDHFRDIAQAQTALNGHPLSDPFYAGEWVWYNPLIAWLLALVSLAAHAPVALVHVQGGPWLNLLGPIAFYALCARVAGRPAALVSLFLLLFVNCRSDPSLTCATYSPWLFVATFAQGLCFLGLIALEEAARRDTDVAAAGAGALAGLTFLAHTAPAIVLGCVALVMLRPRRVLVAGAVALVVASPFLLSIVGHYHLHIANEAPVAWVWPPLSRESIHEKLLENAPLLLSAVVGAAVLRSRLAYAWAAAALLWMAYGLLREGTSLPAIVPSFHFWRYTLAAAALFAGAAVTWMLRRAPPAITMIALPAALVGTAFWLAPQYRQRFDFVYGRAIALDRHADLNDTAVFLRKSLPQESIVLGSRGLTLQVIGPSGHHVVGVEPAWSNPYLPVEPRVSARNAMLDDIHAGRVAAYEARADEYGVTHAVGLGADECAAMTAAGLQHLYQFGNACVFARSHGPVR